MSPPTNPVRFTYLEGLILGGLLIQLALRWGTLIHAQVHQGRSIEHCTFTVTRALEQVHDRLCPNPAQSFTMWARVFSDDLVRTHPPSPAQRVCAILRSSTAELPGLRQLSEMVGVTPARLRRTFRLERGVALPDYLRRVRLLRALQALNDEPRKIEPVALEVGYRGKKNFYRLFKQRTGMTPSQFRELPRLRALQIIEDTRLSLLGHARRRIGAADGAFAQRPT